MCSSPLPTTLAISVMIDWLCYSAARSEAKIARRPLPVRWYPASRLIQKQVWEVSGMSGQPEPLLL
ncbi:hypothetical protein SCLCIDRAFT_1210216 [Scleroderma citrinum Foug A]|uniref:Uncharacterized protein n=1 Tax=Scleroderma citrinum Foug A TaxID=1036808 RepID=A0A0C3E426_9AGAM|nr:hypothetical protein SCLCIDRAFT_1210216 [Scleroderma citrinum Foug A]